MKELVVDRLSSQKSKLLSQAGRYTLVKSIISSIPIYSMSTCLLLVSLSHSLDSLARKFLWFGTIDKRCSYQIPQNTLCKPKSLGGLGLRSFNLMSKAMIAKLGWTSWSKRANFGFKLLRLCSFSFLISSAAPKGKVVFGYGPAFSSLKRFSNWVFVFVQVLVLKLISVWHDPWIPTIQGFKPVPRNNAHLSFNGVVADLKDPNGNWNYSLLNQLFIGETIHKIVAMHWIDNRRNDDLIWLPTRNGCFTVKSAYSLLTHPSTLGPPSSSIQNKLWRSKLHGRLKFLLWKILVGTLPTRSRLVQRLVADTTICPFCSLFEEHVLQLFFFCSFAKALWFFLPWSIKWDSWTSSFSVLDFFNAILDPERLLPMLSQDSDSFLLSVALLFEKIWLCRNDLVFQHHQHVISEVISSLFRRKAEFSSSLHSDNITFQRSLGPTSLCWKALPLSFIKINVDVAMNDGFCTLGMVVRNWWGEILKLITCKDFITVVIAAEEKPILLALLVTRSSSWPLIQVESVEKSIFYLI